MRQLSTLIDGSYGNSLRPQESTDFPFLPAESLLVSASSMKNAAFGVIFLCSIITAHAAPPSDESLVKMMNSLQLHVTLDQMVAQLDAGMKAGMKELTKGKELDPLRTAELGQLQSRTSAIIKDEFSFAKMKGIYLKVYGEMFTQEEVNSINAFYASPAGKAMIEKIPLATKKATPLLHERINLVTQEIKKLQQEFIKGQNQPP